MICSNACPHVNAWLAWCTHCTAKRYGTPPYGKLILEKISQLALQSIANESSLDIDTVSDLSLKWARNYSIMMPLKEQTRRRISFKNIHVASVAVPLLSQARWRSLILMLLRFSKSFKSWFHTSKSLASSQTQSKHGGRLKGNSKCPRASYMPCTEWLEFIPALTAWSPPLTTCWVDGSIGSLLAPRLQLDICRLP